MHLLGCLVPLEHFGNSPGTFRNALDPLERRTGIMNGQERNAHHCRKFMQGSMDLGESHQGALHNLGRNPDFKAARQQ